MVPGAPAVVRPLSSGAAFVQRGVEVFALENRAPSDFI